MLDENQAKAMVDDIRKRLANGDTTVVDQVKNLYKQWEPMLSMAGIRVTDDMLNKLDMNTLRSLSGDDIVRDNMSPAMQILSTFLQGKK